MTIILHWSPDHGREESPMCCRGESIQRIIAVMLQWLPQITEIWDSKSQAQVIRGENYAPSWSCQGPSLRIKAEVSSTQQCEPAGGKVRYKKKPHNHPSWQKMCIACLKQENLFGCTHVGCLEGFHRSMAPPLSLRKELYLLLLLGLTAQLWRSDCNRTMESTAGSKAWKHREAFPRL